MVWIQNLQTSLYSTNQFLGLDFFCRFLQQDGSKILYFVANNWTGIGRKNMFVTPNYNNSNKWKFSSSCHSFLNSIFSEFTNVQLISNKLNSGHLYLISKKDKTKQIDFLLIREVVKSRNYAMNSSKIITDAGCVAACTTIVLPGRQAVCKLEKNKILYPSDIKKDKTKQMFFFC